MIYFRRGIPQNVKFKVGWGASVGLLESIHSHLHDISGNSQSRTGVLRVAAGPKLGANLVS